MVSSMLPVYVVLSLLLGWVSYVFGRRLGRRGVGWGYAGATVALGLVLAYLAQTRYPQLVWWIPWPDYAYFHVSWFLWPALTLIGIGREFVPQERDQRGLRLLAAVLGVLLVYSNASLFFPTGAAGAEETIFEGDVCIQSTQYTCGAAALVTFLRRYGVELSEEEAAEAAVVRPYVGVSLPGLRRGIEAGLGSRGAEAEVMQPTWQELQDLPMPALTTVRLTALIDHVVCLLEVHPTHVVVGDPLSGRALWRRQDLEDRWRGTVIYVDPRAAESRVATSTARLGP